MDDELAVESGATLRGISVTSYGLVGELFGLIEAQALVQWWSYSVNGR